MRQRCGERPNAVAAVQRVVVSGWRRLAALGSDTSRDRLLWAVRIRWLAIGGFSALAGVASACGVLPSLHAAMVAGLASATLNAGNHWCVVRGRYLRSVTALAIPADVVLITYLVVRTGGPHSPFIILYVVQVVATAMLVHLVVAGVAACASAGFFLAGVWVFQPVAGGFDIRDGTYQVIWGLFLLYCLALLTYLAGYIGDRLRQSEDDLAERNRHLAGALASLEAAHADLQRTVERLKTTESQLVHSEKMRALGQFVTGIAHELNNPIGFIRGNLDHVRRAALAFDAMLSAYAEVPVPPPVADALAARRRMLRLTELRDDLPSALADCEEGARRASEIVASLRAFARADAPGAWSRVDLRMRLDRTIALARHRLGGASVERDYGDVPPIECLAGQLDQVWLNLLANAADAVRGCGTIRVRIAVDAEPRASTAAPILSVAVADDGPGMPADVRARIFDPFFTTKPEGQGTGLGLSVSYGIVERHGGTIAVDSQPGRGTVITVRLPLNQSRTAGAVDAAAAAGAVRA